MKGIRILLMLGVVVTGAITVAGCAMFGGGGDESEVDFVTDIKPIFEHRCLQCHAGSSPDGGLSLEDREVVMKTYRSGSKLLDPGYSKRSLLYVAIVRPGAHPEMMPADGWKLTQDQLIALRDWIDQGAEWPKGKAGKLKVKKLRVDMDEAP